MTAPAPAVRVLWAPWPYRAGFCITDDTDAATTASVRAVYDALHEHGLTATKTVWAYEPEEPCGIPSTPASTLRGVTLADPEYLALVRDLASRGFEVALHGASAGNNRRERTIAALDLAGDLFGGTDTFICHSKNADNLYWEQKVAPNAALRRLLSLYSRHACSGEIEGSPYFWGDVARERVRHIRLFRTRNTNTLAVDPEMPYFETAKPYVRGWFSATKRSFHDCTTAEALRRLVDENGLTVLYQYLHRYARPDGTVDPVFLADAARLAGESRIWSATAGAAMARLRQMQGVVIATRGREAWIANAGAGAVHDVQLLVPDGVDASAAGAERHGEVLRLPSLAAGAVLPLGLPAPAHFAGARALRLDAAGRGRRRLGLATAYVNAGDTPWEVAGTTVPAGAARLVGDAGYAVDPPLSVPGQAYRTRLFAGQMAIITRELALRRRSMDPEAFLGAETIPLEDHGNW